MDITKALETDVLVVGAGNAASVAALAAHDLGAKVVLMERAPKERRGGNSAFSGGLFRFAFSDFEQLKSIVKETAGAEFNNVEVEPYPKDRFYGDLMRVTDGLADPVLTELLVERSQDVVTWMAQHGVVWELHMSHCARVKGKLVWRTGTTPVAAREGGKGLMEMHFATVEKRGLEVIYSARALELLVDQSGAIEGVLIATPAGRQ
ncbi:MAG TPA: FAD-binding protein, partial [Candidatus Acidoferrum sp.]|nr:FAD-binding protein [Candidatus Acidoferrum sp.]